MDTLQGLEALIQQEGCVINQHVDVAHKLFARAVRGQQEKKKKRFSIWKTTFTHLKTNEKKSLRDWHWLELLHEGAMVGKILPEALEDGANMVPYSKLVVKLTGGTGVLNILAEETETQTRRTAFRKHI